MPNIDSKEQEIQGMMQTANLMVVAARTAPKSGGVDDIYTAVVYGDEKEHLAVEMEKIADERKRDRFKQDAQTVRQSEVIVLIGVRGTKKFGLNCGACGHVSCEGFEKAERLLGNFFTGPTCVYKALDMGIAIGSAVKTASMLNVDNRIMNTIGGAARQLNYMPDASIIMGIPLSVSGKSPYFDRT